MIHSLKFVRSFFALHSLFCINPQERANVPNALALKINLEEKNAIDRMERTNERRNEPSSKRSDRIHRDFIQKGEDTRMKHCGKCFVAKMNTKKKRNENKQNK